MFLSYITVLKVKLSLNSDNTSSQPGDEESEEGGLGGGTVGAGIDEIER